MDQQNTPMNYGGTETQATQPSESQPAPAQSRAPAGYKKSILVRVVAIFVILTLIVVVIDPLTTNINEGEIIFKGVFYPYFKLKAHFTEEVDDYDKDGIPDYDEIHGWEMSSDIVTLRTQGDSLSYRFHCQRDGFHLLSVRYQSLVQLNLNIDIVGVSFNDSQTLALNSSLGDYQEEILFPKFQMVEDEEMEFTLTLMEDGELSLDWVKLRKIGSFFGSVQDADDYTLASPGSGTPIASSTATINYQTDWKNADSDFDGMLDGYELTTGRANGGWTEPMVTNQRYAVLIGGGSANDVENYLAFENAIITMYKALHNTYGYTNDNIFVQFWDGEPLALDIVDGDGGVESVKGVFDYLSRQSTDNDLLMVYLTSHGNYDADNMQGSVKFYADPDAYGGEVPVSYDKLAEYINNVTASEKIFIVEACQSGSAALAFEAGDNVMVFSSSTKEDPTFVYPNGNPPFTYQFTQALTNPILGSIPTLNEIKDLDVELEESDFISIGTAYEKSRGKLGVTLEGSSFDEWSKQEPQQNDVAEVHGDKVYL